VIRHIRGHSNLYLKSSKIFKYHEILLYKNLTTEGFKTFYFQPLTLLEPKVLISSLIYRSRFVMLLYKKQKIVFLVPYRSQTCCPYISM
jgi:hypothetical protein